MSIRGFVKYERNKWPCERNPESNAYVPYDKGKYYVQGAFNGGKAEEYLKMIDELDKKTEEDLERGIIAAWHDESFLNRYILDRSDIQILGRQYLYFEEYILPYERVMMVRDKKKYLDVNKVKNVSNPQKNKIKSVLLQKIKNIKDKILIALKIEPWLKIEDSNGNYIDNDLNI